MECMINCKVNAENNTLLYPSISVEVYNSPL
jgi:hypothetical protein